MGICVQCGEVHYDHHGLALAGGGRGRRMSEVSVQGSVDVEGIDLDQNG